LALIFGSLFGLFMIKSRAFRYLAALAGLVIAGLIGYAFLYDLDYHTKQDAEYERRMQASEQAKAQAREQAPVLEPTPLSTPEPILTPNPEIQAPAPSRPQLVQAASAESALGQTAGKALARIPAIE
jgi:Flp pilus assembly protein TadB